MMIIKHFGPNPETWGVWRTSKLPEAVRAKMASRERFSWPMFPSMLATAPAQVMPWDEVASSRIENETDPAKQNALIAQQNKLLSYMNGLGVGVGSSDTVLLKRLKSMK